MQICWLRYYFTESIGPIQQHTALYVVSLLTVQRIPHKNFAAKSCTQPDADKNCKGKVFTHNSIEQKELQEGNHIKEL